MGEETSKEEVEEGEIWEQPNRRRRNKNKPSWKRFEFDNATTFLTTNIPTWCSRADIWSEFKIFGELVDVFIPKRLDRGGNRYAFLRYDNIKDCNKFLQVLNAVRLQGAKLVVAKAKFKRDGQPFEETPEQPVNLKQPNNDQTQQYHHLRNDENRVKSSRSYKDAVKGKPVWCTKSIHIQLDESKAIKAWSKNSLLVEAKDIGILCNLHEITRNLTPYISHLRYTGGLTFLMSFYRGTHCEAFFNHYVDSKSRWFSKIERWYGQNTIVDRLAWLRIDGIPAFAWDVSVFNQIGSNFGRVISPSKAGDNDCNLSFEIVGVLTNSTTEINEEVQIMVLNNTVTVRVHEVCKFWVPDFLAAGRGIPSNDPYRKSTTHGLSSEDDSTDKGARAREVVTPAKSDRESPNGCMGSGEEVDPPIIANCQALQKDNSKSNSLQTTKAAIIHEGILESENGTIGGTFIDAENKENWRSTEGEGPVDKILENGEEHQRSAPRELEEPMYAENGDNNIIRKHGENWSAMAENVVANEILLNNANLHDTFGEGSGDGFNLADKSKSNIEGRLVGELFPKDGDRIEVGHISREVSKSNMDEPAMGDKHGAENVVGTKEVDQSKDIYFFNSLAKKQKRFRRPKNGTHHKKKAYNSDSSPSSGNRPKKRSRLEEDDPFDIDRFIGISKPVETQVREDGRNTEGSSNDLNVQACSDLDNMALLSSRPSKPSMEGGSCSSPAGELEVDKEVEATIEMGSLLGIDLSNHVDWTRESILDEGFL